MLLVVSCTPRDEPRRGGVFEDWEQSLTSDKDFARIEEESRAQASAYVGSISEETWPQWRVRIFEFCKTESNDLATFPIYFEFLRELAERRSNRAFELVKKHIAEVEHFTIPIYRGLWASDLKDACRALLMELCDQGRQLTAMAKLFLWDIEADRELLKKVLEKASKTRDEDVLSLLLEVAASQISYDKNFAIAELFIPALKRLKELGCKYWVRMLWHSRKIRDLVSHLSQEQAKLLLDALVFVDKVEFQAEEVLRPIADAYPELVLDLFRKRVEFKGVNPTTKPFPLASTG